MMLIAALEKLFQAIEYIQFPIKEDLARRTDLQKAESLGMGKTENESTNTAASTAHYMSATNQSVDGQSETNTLNEDRAANSNKAVLDQLADENELFVLNDQIKKLREVMMTDTFYHV